MSGTIIVIDGALLKCAAPERPARCICCARADSQRVRRCSRESTEARRSGAGRLCRVKIAIPAMGAPGRRRFILISVFSPGFPVKPAHFGPPRRRNTSAVPSDFGVRQTAGGHFRRSTSELLRDPPALPAASTKARIREMVAQNYQPAANCSVQKCSRTGQFVVIHTFPEISGYLFGLGPGEQFWNRQPATSLVKLETLAGNLFVVPGSGS